MSVDQSNAGFVKKWQIAGPALERFLNEELRNVNVPASMEILSDAYEAALRCAPRRVESGLVQQQALFRKGLAREKAAGRRC
jgi:hypothetical protein